MERNRKKDFISIIIPVYNAAPYLKRTLDSVLYQTFTDWELILVDDASTDDSLAVIQNWRKGKEHFALIVLESLEHRGAAHARNLGMQNANGQYLAYLDADDYWLANKLENQFRFMKQNGYAFSFTGYEFANAAGERKGKVVQVPNRITYEEALTNTTISTITVMFDQQQIPESLLWMPENCQREDTATWWNILKNGYIAYGLNEVLSVYCRHRGSHSANKVKAVLGTYRMYRQQEQLTLFSTIVCMVKYIRGAVKRRL